MLGFTDLLSFSLPSIPLPAFSLPTNIQRRFFSFVLRLGAGRYLKPGQLDANQIEAQISRGRLEIKDVELEPQAVNERLAGLPLELIEGTVGSASVQIPTTNIFTAPLNATLSTLRLTFHLRPAPPATQPSDVDLTQSVTSVAETFVHDELTERDARHLHESILGLGLDDEDERRPPGSIDPYLDDDRIDELDAPSHQLEMEGVSVFTSIATAIVARLAFVASDVEIRLIHPGETEYIIRVPEFAFTNEEDGEDSTVKVRTIKVTGVTVSCKNLRVDRSLHRMSSVGSLHSDTEGLRSAAGSSSEEDLHASMLHSTVSLPMSSMYQSATSFVNHSPTHSPTSTRASPVLSKHPSVPKDPPEESILSLSSEPIIIRIKNVFPLEVVGALSSAAASPSSERQMYMSQDTVRVVTELQRRAQTYIEVTVGVFAAALKTRQVRAVLSSAQFALPPSSGTASGGPDSASPSPAPQLSLKLKGIALLLLQDPEASPELVAKFLNNPLSPPIPTSHIRIYVEGIEATLGSGSLNPTSMTAIPNTRASHLPSTSSSSRQVASCTISDLSIFNISPSGTFEGNDTWTTSPILIHDSLLPHQYDPTNAAFPTFEVADWRKAEGLSVKTTRWKARVSSQMKRRPSSSSGVPTNSPAIHVQTELGVSAPILEVAIQPLHVFLDLDILKDLLPFVTQALETSEPDSGQGNVTPSADPFRDPSLQGTPKPGFAELGDPDAQNSPTSKSKAGATAVVQCSMIRVQVRTPSPPTRPSVGMEPSPMRSGSFVLDVQGLHLVSGDSAQGRQGARFSQNQAGGVRSSKKKLLAQVEWSRMIMSLAGAHEPRATALVSIKGRTLDDHDVEPETLSRPALYVRQTILKKADDVPSTSIEIRIPRVDVNLSKSSLDGLQLWADDAAQWADRTFGESSGTDTGNPSLIGSRYFAPNPKTLNSLTTISSRTATIRESGKKTSEMVISLVVDEASVQLNVPRGPPEGTMDARPFKIFASEIDALVEVKPEGKNETVISLAVGDAKIADTSSSDTLVTFLEMTNPPVHVASSRPLVKVRVTSSTEPETGAKQSAIRVTGSGFTYILSSDITWVDEIARFVKAPPGAFESVVPSERTRIWVKLHDCSLQVVAPNHKGALAVALDEVELLTELISEDVNTSLQVRVPQLRVLFIDAIPPPDAAVETHGRRHPSTGFEKRSAQGYAFIAQVAELDTMITSCSMPVSNNVDIMKLRLSLHLCADTVAAIAAFGADFASAFQPPEIPHAPETPKTKPVQMTRRPKQDLMSSIDEDAFRLAPEVETPGDMMSDDLPTNLDYLDAAYGSAAGVNAYSDEDDFGEPSDDEEGEASLGPATPISETPPETTPSNIRGETIKMLTTDGIKIIEDYYDTVTPVDDDGGPAFDYGLVARVRAKDVEVKVHLHDGYDWVATRKSIEEEVKAMRRKLIKIRQLLASGQVPDSTVEETHAMLFNSVHIGLPENVDEFETGELIAAIDKELDDEDAETGTQSSWQSLNRPQAPSTSGPPPRSSKSYRVRGKKLTRSKHSRIDVCLYNLEAEVDKLHPNELELVSRVLVKVKDLEILDHIKTSTWKKFLTETKTDAKGNIRETDSYMAKVELKMVKPSKGLDHEEARLRMKLLPLRLRVDQDALDFLKAFGAFKAPDDVQPSAPPTKSSSNEIYFQHVEVFPVGLKLDYKPKRVDYKALREGKTIELMNFFHFDGAEMTLRHIQLNGIQGWATLGDTLNDLWTPDVKANQLVDVISGIAPIRSVVNVGSGFADLILLPISQYRKDGRLVRGLQKGATSFMKTTAMEAVKLGAKLATGTQVILEEAENVLGGSSVIVTEPLEGGYAPTTFGSPFSQTREILSEEESDGEGDMRSIRGGATSPVDATPRVVSRYADQPNDVREGVEAAYKSLGKNFNSAAQTILAVPMEVYERSGNEGAVRKVIRAVPIAVLKPMIGATEAVSKTLLGLRNTLDPENRQENEEKYKR